MSLTRLQLKYRRWRKPNTKRTFGEIIHMDWLLLSAIFLLAGVGLIILFSATNQNMHLMHAQMSKLLLALFGLFFMAQIPPQAYCRWAPTLYTISCFLLIAVLIIGHVDKGARRWIDIGILRFQPSELIKITLPLMLASYMSNKLLPPTFKQMCIISLLTLLPMLLIAKEPDLGTALMIGLSGILIIFLSGISWRFILSLLSVFLGCLPILWHFMHTYQRKRILTFLYPERDPLGSGYHIIQSKIAIGSGGLLGKGWLHGTQAHLAFLPEHATDFIFAVLGEEFGLIGCLILLCIYTFITVRCFMIAYQAQTTFARLLAGTLGLLFFLCAFVNIGMVCGILPVVGLPLPLVSYGGTSVVTLCASFGILMSIHTHKRLF